MLEAPLKIEFEYRAHFFLN